MNISNLQTFEQEQITKRKSCCNSLHTPKARSCFVNIKQKVGLMQISPIWIAVSTFWVLPRYLDVGGGGILEITFGLEMK